LALNLGFLAMAQAVREEVVSLFIPCDGFGIGVQGIAFLIGWT